MRECDLIMKGGITSGVVYPKAIEVISEEYRLRSIGGSSAGAIAAAISAAAEYRRQMAPGDNPRAGYDRIGELAKELASVMRHLFQPYPIFADLFELGIVIVSGKRNARAVVTAMFRAFKTTLLLAALGVIVAVLLGWAAKNLWLGILGVLICVLAAIAYIVASVTIRVFRDLPRHDYGLCSGLTVEGNTEAGLTNWIADRIDQVAGKSVDGDPLTIRELEEAEVELAVMTTDLSSQRPYQLPMRSRHHFFSRSEFEKLFPMRIVEYLCRGKTPGSSGAADGPEDLYPLPIGGDFPVMLCARMSLSFPGLISAVPLWRKDFTAMDPDGNWGVYKRCLFSDGGISSNFPVLFFDALLPRRPTFGISLASWDDGRHGDERVHLSEAPVQSTHVPVLRVDGILSFLWSILNTAKDWQDTLQSKLPGYAERIVEIRLDDSREGGLNLHMDSDTIEQLNEYGRRAGRKLLEKFDFNEHRWRRALSVLPAIEDALVSMHSAYSINPIGYGADALGYSEILTEYVPKLYANRAKWRKDILDAFAARLTEIGRDATKTEAGTVGSGNVPSQDASLRLLANADRRPDE